MTNVNPETGVRYGIISANSLDPEVICDLQAVGRDVHWEARKQEIIDALQMEVDNGAEFEFDEELENRLERESYDFYDDEPVHEFQRDGVRGRTTWLGGALLVFVFHSQWTTNARLCSPCVPGCCDLDSIDPNGYEGYDVNPEWRIR